MTSPGTAVPGVRHGPPASLPAARAPARRRAPARVRRGAARARPCRRAGAAAAARRAPRGARPRALRAAPRRRRRTRHGRGRRLVPRRRPRRAPAVARRPPGLRARAAAAPRRRAGASPRRARARRARLRLRVRGLGGHAAAGRAPGAARARARRRAGDRVARRAARARRLRARRARRGARPDRRARRARRRVPEHRPRAVPHRALRRRDREHPRLLALHAARAPRSRARHRLSRPPNAGSTPPRSGCRTKTSRRDPGRPRAAAPARSGLRLAARRGARDLGRGGPRRDRRSTARPSSTRCRRASRSRSTRSARRSSPAASPRPRTSSQGLLRQGLDVVVTFPHRGEAERRRGLLRRVEPQMLEPGEEPTGLAVRRRRRRGAASSGATSASRSCPTPRSSAAARPRATAPAGRALASFSDLRTGDYVVHEDHGISQLLGFETKEVAGVTRDYLLLGFRGEDRVYVPHEQIGKVSRYIGADSHAPTLSKLGGKAWENLKVRAREHLREMAGELLQLYAERQTRVGVAYDTDQEWIEQLEAGFPYRETEDQSRAIEAVKEDLEAPRPMDRLVCGDVGFGKTEVALRAAFTVAVAGQAGADARPDDDPRPAALEHVPRPLPRLPGPRRDGVALPQARRGEEGARRVRRGQGRRPDRHAPDPLARRDPEGSRPRRRRRGAAVRRRAEGAAAAAPRSRSTCSR